MAIANLAPSADWGDVQGLVLRGYKKLDHACYMLLRIDDPSQAKLLIARVAADVPSAKPHKDERAVHLAISAAGFRKLGVQAEKLNTFSKPFQEGMVTPHRSRLLGDYGPNDPTHWRWGNSVDSTPDLLLMAFAKTEEDLGVLCAEMLGESNGCTVLHQIEALNSPDKLDHFGFKDGISQPRIQGAETTTGVMPGDTVAGEFVLGYRDSRGAMTSAPEIGVEQPGDEAFGKNGTYLILRQMDQDVQGFLDYLPKHGLDPDYLAAKLVGRWKNGTPLDKYPDAELPAYVPNDADESFDFAEDPFGHKCPIGSHIRRANPRKGLVDPDENTKAKQKESKEIISHHRLMRRGRIYGPLWRPDSGVPCPTATRGLHFLCLAASIGNQFEFVQQTWLNGPKFAGLYDEVDPMIGISKAPDGACTFSIPGSPVRKRILDMPRFITVRGGAYFFLPGLRGLHMLSRL